MSDLPQISEAEFEVMKIVWKHAPISTNEITDKLLQTTSWSPKTIQTLIKRLVTKGVLTYEKQSRVFVYTPVVKESEYIGQESNSFLERYYDGNIKSRRVQEKLGFVYRYTTKDLDVPLVGEKRTAHVFPPIQKPGMVITVPSV